MFTPARLYMRSKARKLRGVIFGGANIEKRWAKTTLKATLKTSLLNHNRISLHSLFSPSVSQYDSEWKPAGRLTSSGDVLRRTRHEFWWKGAGARVIDPSGQVNREAATETKVIGNGLMVSPCDLLPPLVKNRNHLRVKRSIFHPTRLLCSPLERKKMTLRQLSLTHSPTFCHWFAFVGIYWDSFSDGSVKENQKAWHIGSTIRRPARAVIHAYPGNIFINCRLEENEEMKLSTLSQVRFSR